VTRVWGRRQEDITARARGYSRLRTGHLLLEAAVVAAASLSREEDDLAHEDVEFYRGNDPRRGFASRADRSASRHMIVAAS